MIFSFMGYFFNPPPKKKEVKGMKEKTVGQTDSELQRRA